MLADQFYQPSQLPNLKKQNKNHTYGFQRISSATSERSLITAILHMMLGLSSDIFILNKDKFSVCFDYPTVQHLSRQALLIELNKLVEVSNQLVFVRSSVEQLKKMEQKMLQAFAMGVHEEVVEIEKSISEKLMGLHKQQGIIVRNQSEILESELEPTSILSLAPKLSSEIDNIFKLCQILSQISIQQATSNQDAQRSTIFLLNFYYKQCQLEYLTETKFTLHHPFKTCLRAYLDICKQWVSFSQSKLQAYSNCGFFIDMTRALSMNGDRFFEINKMVDRQLIPDIFAKNFKRVIELGKTVQFIKLYLSQEDLLLFYQFLDVAREYQPIQTLFSQQKSQTKIQKKTQNYSISSRCMKPKKKYRGIEYKTQQNPYGIFSNSPSFFHLRALHQKSSEKTIIQVEKSKYNSPKIKDNFSNPELIEKLDSFLSRIALKCKIVLKQKNIKQSIQYTLHGIKRYILLGQGDFVHEFIQFSGTVLDKTTEKISRNNVERIIEEALKCRTQNNTFDQLKESLSFVFLRSEASVSKGWKAFSFTFKSERPVNFIFNAECMHSYESIGNLLFCLRHCEHIFVSFWKKSIRTKSSLLLKTRLALQRFIASLQTYLFTEIQQNWNNLLNILQTCDSILTFLEANNFFLEELKKLTVENKYLCNLMLSLVKIVQKLENISTKLQLDPSYQTQTDIQLIWSWFLNLMDQAKQIPQLADSFDFNFDTPHL